MNSRANGVILWEGSSAHNGQPIVAILTGFRRESQNAKTGPMAQIFILCRDLSPMAALDVGADEAVCGDCPLRQSLGGACYVEIAKSVQSVWLAYQRGRYSYPTDDDLARIAALDASRIGAYGDGAMVPSKVWADLLVNTNGCHTAYTAQWRGQPALASIYMASVQSVADKLEAARLGFRTFRVCQEGEPLQADEIACPSDRGITCAECQLCNGARPGDARKSIAIPVHGPRAKRLTVVG